MKLSKIKRDVDLCENGVWVIGAYGDIDVCIASIANKQFTTMLRKELRPYERAIRQKTMDDDLFAKIYNKCVAKAVLLGWKNMQDDEGNDIPYGTEKATEVLNDPAYVDFRDLVMALAEEAEVFRKQTVEDVTFQA